MLASPLRLTHPLRRTTPRGAAKPEWETISWDEALDEIAQKLLAQRAAHGAESVAFAVTTPSGTPMVDSVEWVERFIRLFGSPNLLYAVEVCGWHKDYAHALTFGRGIGVPDLESTDIVLLWGFNPARTWLAQATRIAEAHQRGAVVVVVDPKQEGSGQQADLWMPVRPGADAALALGAIRHLLETDSYDIDFVRQWSDAALLVDTESGQRIRASELWDGASPENFVLQLPSGELCPSGDPLDDAPAALYAEGHCTDRLGKPRHYASALQLLKQHVAPYTPEHVANVTWIDKRKLEQFNTLFMHSPKLSYYTWTGVGQHTNATQTERAIATLYALTGACDKQGGNLWTVAPPYRSVNDYEQLLPQAQRAKALGIEDLPLGPPRLGWITSRDLHQAVVNKLPYAVNALVSFGTNILATQADTQRNERMLQSLDFHVHVDMFMNPTAEHADIVLPASLPWERDALKFGFEISQAAVEHIQLRPKMVEGPGEVRSDYAIVLELAKRMGMGHDFFNGDIEAGWNYQLAPLGITVGNLRDKPEGIRLAQPTGYQKFSRKRANGSAAGFATPTRRVELYSESLLNIGQPAIAHFVEPAQHPGSDAAYPIVLTTAKNGWYVHSSHRHLAALRRKSPDPFIQIGTALATSIQARNGDWLRVITSTGSVKLKALIAPSLHAQTAIADFGWWQACDPLGRGQTAMYGPASSNINAILSDTHRDPVSGSVPLRATMCNIAVDASANRGCWTGVRLFRVQSKERVVDDIMRFNLVPDDGGALPDFLPGQHVIISVLAGDLRRAYSLVGPNQDPSVLSIAVRLARTHQQPNGKMSSLLHNLEPGVLVQLAPPSGVFTIPVHTQRPLVLVAGGIGITPFLGFLEALAQQKDRGAPTPQVRILLSVRTGAEHPFAHRLCELAKHIGTVEVDLQSNSGLPDLRVFTDIFLQQRPLIYLCGSPGFLTAIRQALVQKHIPHFDIFEETFASETKIPPKLQPQTIRIADTDQTFEWTPAAGTLLDAADLAGLSLPSGCRVGQCESCCLTVVEGKVAHLGEWDGAPDQCLTCQSVPLSPVVLRQ